MKLKYYLRGIGIGVIVTTLIFMISISIHKDDVKVEPKNTEKQAGETIAQATRSDTESTEILPTETSENGISSTEPPVSSESETPSTEQPVSSESEVSSTEPFSSETEISSEAGGTPPGTQVPPQDTGVPQGSGSPSGGEAVPEIVSFTVGSGEYSDSIAKRLAEQQLVDDATAFNQFLVTKNYDNFILPGTYSIPKNSTYDEIAALLTTKPVKAAN